MNSINDNEQRMIVSLMITALNVLPRLAYYYSADLWRLNTIEKNITDPTDLISSWWKFRYYNILYTFQNSLLQFVYFYNVNIIVCIIRQEYEGVSSVNKNNPTFLDDIHIIMNKPYLP